MFKQRQVIEFYDESSNLMAFRANFSSDDIDNKSQLFVRESQVAVFSHNGSLADVFQPGRYDLNINSFPLLSRLWNWIKGRKVTADVYFVNTKQFTNILWGTPSPINMSDADYGAVQVRINGGFSFRVKDAPTFMREVFGQNRTFVTEEITKWLKQFIVEAINIVVGGSGLSYRQLSANLRNFNEDVKQIVIESFGNLGLQLANLTITSVSVPEEQQRKFDDHDELMRKHKTIDIESRLAANEALIAAAKNPGQGSAFMQAGMGMQMGHMMGQMLGQSFGQNQQQPQHQNHNQQQPSQNLCINCRAALADGMMFCGKCGAKQQAECANCKCALAPDVRFCGKCGTPR